jgi:hypothetical protein
VGQRKAEGEAEQDEMLKNEGQEASLDGIEEELRDFLAADALDVPIDPVFKERLRRELWDIVAQNAPKWRSARADSNSDGDLNLDLNLALGPDLDSDDESS